MDVITWGEAMVALAPQEMGSLDNVITFQKRLAGAESNVSIGLARLGHEAAWMSKVGTDSFGRFVLKNLRGEGVDVSRVSRDRLRPTGVLFKEFLGNGRTNTFYYRQYSAASQLTLEDIDLRKFSAAKFLFITGITPALSETNHKTMLASIKVAHELGMTVVFDPNIRQKLWTIDRFKPTLLEIAAMVDIILPGVEEGELLVDERDPVKMAKRFLEMGAQAAVIKLGPEGAYFRTSVDYDEPAEGYVSGFKVHFVNEVGAGDAFAAGLISGLLDNLPMQEAVRRASALGALAVTSVGDYDALPYREDLEAFITGVNAAMR